MESGGVLEYVEDSFVFAALYFLVVGVYVQVFFDKIKIVWFESFWWGVRIRGILWSPIDGDQSFLVEWIGGKSSSKC